MTIICQVPEELIVGKTVLSISDTSGVNLEKHKHRIQNIDKVGVLENNKSKGFHVHASLAVDADSGAVLGLADTLIWHRPAVEQCKDRKVRGSMSPDQLENHKWCLGASHASKVLASANQIVHVCDRESDDYVFMDSVMSRGEDFVVRSKHNRKILCHDGQGEIAERTKSCLATTESLGQIELVLPATTTITRDRRQIKRPSRNVKLEIRSRKITIPVPSAQKKHAQSQQLDLWFVEAKEVDCEGIKKPILWQILTSIPCPNFEAACKVIGYYQKRWTIEQLFRTTKSEGFDIEGTELETIEAIEKQTMLALEAATKVMQLVYARTNTESFPITAIFDQQEQQMLHSLNQTLQGKTEKLKNPYPITQASYAAWIIARLGGWKGYQSQRPPGPITMKRGLDKFTNFINVMRLLNTS